MGVFEVDRDYSIYSSLEANMSKHVSSWIRGKGMQLTHRPSGLHPFPGPENHESDPPVSFLLQLNTEIYLSAMTWSRTACLDLHCLIFPRQTGAHSSI